MKKIKLLNIALTLVMLLGMFGVKISAKEITDNTVPGITIDTATGERINVVKYDSDTKKYIVNEGQDFPNGGSFTYDDSTYTLTITNADLRAVAIDGWSPKNETVINIKFVGNNKIHNLNEGEYPDIPLNIGMDAIIEFAEGSTLEIVGDGAIAAQFRHNVTIKGGKITSPQTQGGFVTLNGDLTLDGTELEMTVKESAGFPGIWNQDYEDNVQGKTIIKNGSKINITTAGLGIWSGDLDVDNSTLNINSTGSYGCYSGTESIDITNNSNVTINSTENPLYAKKEIKVENSVLITSSPDSIQLRAGSGNITIDNSKFKLDSTGNYLIYTDGGKILVDGDEKSYTDYVHHYATLADYIAVESAKAAAEAVENKELYSNYDAVQAAIGAVVEGKDFTEQETVDGYATAITNAINALTYKDADYSKVDAAIAKANGLKKEDYKDFSKVTEAIEAVVRGKNITEQGIVDSYAEVIEKAISELEKKPTPKPESKPETKPNYIIPNTCTK